MGEDCARNIGESKGKGVHCKESAIKGIKKG